MYQYIRRRTKLDFMACYVRVTAEIFAAHEDRFDAPIYKVPEDCSEMKFLP